MRSFFEPIKESDVHYINDEQLRANKSDNTSKFNMNLVGGGLLKPDSSSKTPFKLTEESNMLLWNCHGLGDKAEELAELIEVYDVETVSLLETWREDDMNK